MHSFILTTQIIELTFGQQAEPMLASARFLVSEGRLA